MISVIVPVYNAEQYLKRCVDSILSQTLNHFELILVDDGSTDSSPTILDDYAKRDSRVKVVHQQNAGVSVARNKGLELASGEYVGFIDSDDEVEPCMYEKLLARLSESGADIAFCDSVAINGDKRELETIESLPESSVMKKEEVTPDIILELAGSVCRGLYRAALVRDNSISFPVGLKISEDRIFNIYAIGKAKKVAYLKEVYYKRMILEESTVHRYHSDYYDIVKKGRAATAKALDDAWDGNESFKNAYLVQFVYAALAAIENLKHKDSNLSRIEVRRQIKGICNDSDLISAIRITNYAEKNIKAKWILEKRIGLLSSKKLTVYRFFRRIFVYIKRKLGIGEKR